MILFKENNKYIVLISFALTVAYIWILSLKEESELRSGSHVVAPCVPTTLNSKRSWRWHINTVTNFLEAQLCLSSGKKPTQPGPIV
jgi:hypothetical protein